MVGIFEFLKKKPKKDLTYARMLNNFSPIFSQFGNNIYSSDVVQQAINCIVREMKKLDPQHVISKGSDVTPVYDEIQRVLDNPNELMTTTDFIEKIVWTLFFNYNAFILPTWDANGKLSGLYPLQPVQVDFLEDASNTYFIKFRFENNVETTVKQSDIIHVRYNYSVNDFMGGNRVGQPDNETLLKTLELNDTLLQGVGKALKSSFSINGVVKYNTMLDQSKTEQALKELTDAIQNNESGFMPLDLKGEFIPFTRQISMVDPNTLKFIDEKILRTFGVSLPILTGDYTKEQYEAFYQKTLEPLITSISQAFTKAIFSSRESFGFGHQIMFYPKDLIFLNTAQKLEMIRLLGDSGGLFENEKRVMMGLKPLPELEGVRKQSLNYVDVNIANAYQTGQPEQGTVNGPKNDEVPKQDEQVQDAIDEAVEDVKDIKKEPLLVGQIQALGDIIAGYSAGTYTYNQAKNMLVIGVGLSEDEAEKLLDNQNNAEGGN